MISAVCGATLEKPGVYWCRRLTLAGEARQVIVARDIGPDAVFVNAAGMITMQGAPTFETGLTALAVRDGNIVATGSDQAILSMAGKVPVVDLERAVAMPGLIDSHNHFLSTALGWDRVQLNEARSIGQLLETIGQRAREAPSGEWILCSSRWHETNLSEQRMPTAADLDRVAPNNPVYLPRGGHVVVTNTLGLQRAGIAHDSQDPPGGEFVRDGAGRLTGMLLERPAFSRLTRLLPQPSEEDRRSAIRAGIRAYNRAGITGVREPGLTSAEIQSYQAVIPQEKAIRTSLMWRVDLGMSPEERRRWVQGLAHQSEGDGQWLDVWGLKVTLDGGVEGGYFYAPYANNPDFRGFPFTSQENLAAIIEEAHHLDWRVGIHVVGDAALEMALDAFQAVNARSSTVGRGHALEHAFTPVQRSMERTLAMGIGVTLQHALVYSLAGNMQTYWGTRRAADCTPSRAWLDSGALVGAGTDSPVADFDPWLNVYGFATRDTEVGGIIGPEHRISVAEALRAYTVGSAEILGMGRTLGSLEVGKAADFICLDRDPLSAPLEQVRRMGVLRTFVGGRQVYPLPGDD